MQKLIPQKYKDGHIMVATKNKKPAKCLNNTKKTKNKSVFNE